MTRASFSTVQGRPCRGRYFSHVGKVTKRTLKGVAAGRTLRVLRPGLPLRTPVYGGRPIRIRA